MTPGTGPWAARTDGLPSLVKQPQPVHYRRVSCGAGVLRVSSKLGSSHRTLTTPVEAYAPPSMAIFYHYAGVLQTICGSLNASDRAIGTTTVELPESEPR